MYFMYFISMIKKIRFEYMPGLCHWHARLTATVAESYDVLLFKLLKKICFFSGIINFIIMLENKTVKLVISVWNVASCLLCTNK